MTPPRDADDVGDVGLEPAPAVAGEIFGDRLELANTYAEILAGRGVVRGLIGPREPGRLWSRHILNSAALADQVPVGAAVLDLGSGAGLPGIPLALARPDLVLTLVEPMLRRVEFLTEVVAELALPNVSVVRARGEDLSPGLVDVVVARAVAPMNRLIPLALPLLRAPGLLLALKGDGAADEIAAAGAVLRRWPDVQVALVRAVVGGETATIVRVVKNKSDAVAAAAKGGRS